MMGPASQRSAPRWLWVGALWSLTLAGCAARPAPPAESAPPPSSDPAASDAPKSDPTEARTFGWLGIAVGAEAAVVATVTSVLMLEDKSTRDSGCTAAKVCSSGGLNANTQIGSLAVWNAGAWILAATGLGIGSYLLITHPPEKRATLSLGPGGVDLTGSF